jgi:urease accessory protein
MRGERPFVFTNLKRGEGLETIASFVIREGMLGSGSPGTAQA